MIDNIVELTPLSEADSINLVKYYSLRIFDPDEFHVD